MPVITLYAGILGLWLVVLSLRVIGARRAGSVSLGDGGDAVLQRRIRAQANFTEYVPFALLLLLALELAGQPALIIHILAGILVVARLLHGWALSFTTSNSFGRFWGTLLTLIVLILASLLCVLALVTGV